ncbi:hypothetical protein EVAR_36206_1 [Eumeta japonica]|uniref:Uncharacterized protein n=1 Tax=Eumeta variegata TaxID=151549 RepID=A0A4C1VSE1_EUMVA|nr:hypothetical protein EVAR_36206_1 [Eumeta japonica]
MATVSGRRASPATSKDDGNVAYGSNRDSKISRPPPQQLSAPGAPGRPRRRTKRKLSLSSGRWIYCKSSPFAGGAPVIGVPPRARRRADNCLRDRNGAPPPPLIRSDKGPVAGRCFIRYSAAARGCPAAARRGAARP